MTVHDRDREECSNNDTDNNHQEIQRTICMLPRLCYRGLSAKRTSIDPDGRYFNRKKQGDLDIRRGCRRSHLRGISSERRAVRADIVSVVDPAPESGMPTKIFPMT